MESGKQGKSHMSPFVHNKKARHLLAETKDGMDDLLKEFDRSFANTKICKQ